MRKIYWLVTPLIFCLGIVVGVFGYIFWQTNFQSGINAPEKSNATKVSQIDSNSYDSNPYFDRFQNNNAGPYQGYTPEPLTEPDVSSHNDLQSQAAAQIALTESEQHILLKDYKQAIGILFDAWKEKDILAFRSKLDSAYTGEILENHVNKAEKYLSKGVGIHVSDVIFDHVAIESADKYSATIDAIYRYTSQDYDLDKQQAYGEKINHFVHVRANLVKIDSQWKITSETPI
ncbi:MAG: hypothetical protein GX207_00130 [Peptococcaceae bacterium]|nr:hypothetical protein [Peptococcaceae bacterium]